MQRSIIEPSVQGATELTGDKLLELTSYAEPDRLGHWTGRIELIFVGDIIFVVYHTTFPTPG